MEASVARHPEAMADSLLKALCGSSRVKIWRTRFWLRSN